LVRHVRCLFEHGFSNNEKTILMAAWRVFKIHF
jgi:hypothetical protein